MKQGLDWYKRDPRAFLDGVQGLGPELIGAYAVILDLIYARDGSTGRDDRHLAGVLGCSVRKARALTDALIERGKIVLDGSDLMNNRATREHFAQKNHREMSAKGGRTKAENERQRNATNGLEPTIREERREEKNDADDCASAREVDQVREAAGVDPAKRLPQQWLDPWVESELGRWRALGLSLPEILDVLRAVSAKRGGPPSSPTYFARPMQEAAGAKGRPALQPIEGGRGPPPPQPIDFDRIWGTGGTS